MNRRMLAKRHETVNNQSDLLPYFSRIFLTPSGEILPIFLAISRNDPVALQMRRILASDWRFLPPAADALAAWLARSFASAKACSASDINSPISSSRLYSRSLSRSFRRLRAGDFRCLLMPSVTKQTGKWISKSSAEQQHS